MDRQKGVNVHKIISAKHFRNISISIAFILILLSCQSQKTARDNLPDIPNEVTIGQIQQAYQNGDYTVTQLTRFYLRRINELSFNGPHLNAVITLNPDALSIAAHLDTLLRQKKAHGALFGIPVLLKDNIDTGDKMPCTAGSRIMKNAFPPKDSPLAAQLRKAGAIILGKANLSEWANFHSHISSSGWSGLGGQTKNPYDITRNPCGSSSGPGVAVAANLCVVAIGTETDGSIVCPANNNGIVGLKPTVGLISRSGIIPISFSQDTGGPMARNVRDAAICLGTMTMIDSSDSKTTAPGRKAYTDYTQFLNPNGLEGKRIGIYKKRAKNNVKVLALLNKAADFFTTHGATVVELDHIIPQQAGASSFTVLLYEFKDGINRYLKNMGRRAPVKNLAELIAKTFADSVEMRYNDHLLLKDAQATDGLQSAKYRKALATMLRLSRQEGLDKVMDAHQLDAIIAPSGSPAWKTDPILGDNFSISSSSPAAIAGYPDISIPMGFIDGLPVGLSIFGRAWSEPLLLEIAYAYEQGTHHRRSPHLASN